MSIAVAIPDIVSPSYFPAIAAIELGLFERRGLAASVVPFFPVDAAYARLRDGKFDYVAGSAHAALYAFPGWSGAELVCALSQHTYWFLVVRNDLDPGTDLQGLRGARVGAAPGPVDGLRWVLSQYGLDPDHDLEVGPIDPSMVKDLSFGVAAATALERGLIDGFWANGMAKEVALRSGVGRQVIDARRDNHPEGMRFLTFPALVTTKARTNKRGEEVSQVREAIVEAQTLLKHDPTVASVAAKRLFPEKERHLIADLVAADAPYYVPEVEKTAVDHINDFGRWLGLTGS